MDRSELVKSLAGLFEGPDDERSSTIEIRQIEKANYKTLIVKERKFIQTNQDYESFINILKCYNTRNLNFIASKLEKNKETFFVEFTDEARTNFLNDIKDLYRRLKNCNSKNIMFVEHMIVEWSNKLFDDINQNKTDGK